MAKLNFQHHYLSADLKLEKTLAITKQLINIFMETDTFYKNS